MVLDGNDNTEKQVTAFLFKWDENEGTLTNDAHLLMQQIRQALNSRLARAKTSLDKSAVEM